MFEVVTGLEVHTQLNTKTKVFCSCATSLGEAPNTNVCLTCSVLPGALPVLNEEAVKKTIAFGKAVNAIINKKSVFNRKNYFYPDLSRAYQISQFNIPIVEKGELFISMNGENKRMGITRTHLEEDVGKNIHENNYSKVDLDRAGTPLFEIISEPELRSSNEAVVYLKKLHSIIRFLDISDANMQEGSFRCNANVSIRPKGDTKLYTRVEIRNLNSFRFIQKVIEYEVKRQNEAWEDGTYEQEVVQGTELFDTTNLVTRSVCGKEEAAEYRYFPDPDLLPVLLEDELLDIRVSELPDEKKARFIDELGIKEGDAEVLISSLEMSRSFESLIALNLNPKFYVNWLNTEPMELLEGELAIENSPVDAIKFGTLIKRIGEGVISVKAAKDVLAHVFENPDMDIDGTTEKLGLKQVSNDSAIEAVVEQISNANADKVAEYKNGKDKLFDFLVGQTMKEGNGAFSPNKVNEILKAKLG